MILAGEGWREAMIPAGGAQRRDTARGWGDDNGRPKHVPPAAASPRTFSLAIAAATLRAADLRRTLACTVTAAARSVLYLARAAAPRRTVWTATAARALRRAAWARRHSRPREHRLRKRTAASRDRAVRTADQRRAAAWSRWAARRERESRTRADRPRLAHCSAAAAAARRAARRASNLGMTPGRKKTFV
eukprot:scaffold7893_cov79-Isochrysis_galbana.AAC.1